MVITPYKVEIDTNWGSNLLKITDQNGQHFFYYQDDKGNLILGQPITVMWQEYQVSLFVPIPREWNLPYVLSIHYSGK